MTSLNEQTCALLQNLEHEHAVDEIKKLHNEHLAKFRAFYGTPFVLSEYVDDVKHSLSRLQQTRLVLSTLSASNVSERVAIAAPEIPLVDCLPTVQDVATATCLSPDVVRPVLEEHEITLKDDTKPKSNSHTQ